MKNTHTTRVERDASNGTRPLMHHVTHAPRSASDKLKDLTLRQGCTRVSTPSESNLTALTVFLAPVFFPFLSLLVPIRLPTKAAISRPRSGLDATDTRPSTTSALIFCHLTNLKRGYVISSEHWHHCGDQCLQDSTRRGRAMEQQRKWSSGRENAATVAYDLSSRLPSSPATIACHHRLPSHLMKHESLHSQPKTKRIATQRTPFDAYRIATLSALKVSR